MSVLFMDLLMNMNGMIKLNNYLYPIFLNICKLMAYIWKSNVCRNLFKVTFYIMNVLFLLLCLIVLFNNQICKTTLYLLVTGYITTFDLMIRCCAVMVYEILIDFINNKPMLIYCNWVEIATKFYYKEMSDIPELTYTNSVIFLGTGLLIFFSLFCIFLISADLLLRFFRMLPSPHQSSCKIWGIINASILSIYYVLFLFVLVEMFML